MRMTCIPIASADNRNEDAGGNDSGVGVPLDRGAREDSDWDSTGDAILSAEAEETAEGTHLSEEMQRVLRGEDPDFQAPQVVPGRASRSCAHLPLVSLETNSKVKKNTKKGTLTLLQPPIPPSHPRRLEPKANMDAMPVGKTCWILHPEYIS